MCEQCITHFATIHPRVIQAIENHKDSFLELMGKIRADMEGSLFNARVVERKQDGEEKDIEGDEYPEFDTFQNLLIAQYVTAFLSQQLTAADQFTGIMYSLHDRGGDDGHAYAQVKQMPRH